MAGRDGPVLEEGVYQARLEWIDELVTWSAKNAIKFIIQ
jgi:hypothetical protein